MLVFSMMNVVSFRMDSKFLVLIFVELFSKIVSVTVFDEATVLAPQLVKKYGYPCETHTVTTGDGYIVMMHRIPGGRSNIRATKAPVLVVHGILASADDWILFGPKQSLGYILADAGYDVWLANVRGTRYSLNHTILNTNNEKYWNFSWHEIGVYDIPSMVDYVLQKTNRSDLYHIGYSQGATTFYVMCSEKPEYNAKIKLHVALAPLAYMNNNKSPLFYFFEPFEVALRDVHIEFLPALSVTSKLAQLFCSDQSPTQKVCVNALFLLFGSNRNEMNTTRLPIIFGHTPAGTSLKQFLHYSQLLKSGKFRQWDAGVRNMMLYGRSTPPDYVLERVTAPVYVYGSKGDPLADELNVKRLERRLPNVKGKHLIADPKFSHIDYLYGVHQFELVYSHVIKTLDDFGLP